MFILLAGSRGVRAQGEPAKPAPPFLSPVPSLTQWKVTYQLKDPADSRKYRVESVTGLKAGKDLKLIYAWAGGQTTEEYVVDGAVFKAVSPKFPDDIVVLDPSSETAFAPRYDKTDFPDLVWVSADNYVRTVREEGFECHLHQLSPEQIAQMGGIASLPEAEQAAAKQMLARIRPKMAWIGAKTRLPVKYDTGYEILTYSFSSAEEKTIAPSEAFRKMIAAHRGREYK